MRDEVALLNYSNQVNSRLRLKPPGDCQHFLLTCSAHQSFVPNLKLPIVTIRLMAIRGYARSLPVIVSTSYLLTFTHLTGRLNVINSVNVNFNAWYSSPAAGYSHVKFFNEVSR